MKVVLGTSFIATQSHANHKFKPKVISNKIYSRFRLNETVSIIFLLPTLNHLY